MRYSSFSVPFSFFGSPLAVVIAFTVLGSLFIPFLAGTLLYLNNRVPFPPPLRKNGILTNFVLLLIVVLYALVGVLEIAELFGR